MFFVLVKYTILDTSLFSGVSEELSLHFSGGFQT